MKLFTDKATTLSANGGRRGMALLMVVTSIAVLTAVVVEFAYDTRVDASIAANARDELRAEYMARSSLAFSRLLLNFQYQFDNLGGAAAQALGGAASAAIPKLRLWDLIPVESESLNTFVGAIAGVPQFEDDDDLPPLDPNGGPSPAVGLQEFGSYEGGFIAEITDEETKINVNKLRVPGESAAAAAQLMAMMQDEKWNFLFEEDNSHGERCTREDVIIRLRDWIDENDTETAIDRVTGALTDGFGDEGAPYMRYRPSYEPKNGYFDSYDELFQVACITDSFMAAFGRQLTVWPDPNAELNINTNDPQQMLMIIYLMADPRGNVSALQNPFVIEKIFEEWNMRRLLGPVVAVRVADLVTILETNGIPVRPEIKNSPQQNPFVGDTSKTFRIEATGQAGDVTSRIVAVVEYGEGLGKLLYFRKE